MMGPGTRAVLAVSEISPGSELFTYSHIDNQSDLAVTMSASGVEVHMRPAIDQVQFFYKHPLTSPPQKEPNEVSATNDGPWDVAGETVLAFGMLEAQVRVKAERAVFELSRYDKGIIRGDVKTLALIATESDLPDVFNPGVDVRDAAGGLMSAWQADLMIVRGQAGGGLLFDGEAMHDIPAYVASEWFKIGAGNVFCALFAHYWGEKKLDPRSAADLASRSSAYYAGTRTLPMIGGNMLPKTETFDPLARCKIFIASPCYSMAQQWLLDQAIISLEKLGVETVSPYDLGLDGAPRGNNDIASVLDDCSAALVLADGVDVPSILAVGLARVRKLPIVILAEELKERRLELWHGTDCEIARDFASAVYRAMVAGKKRTRR
jgi:hypothetical protein